MNIAQHLATTLKTLRQQRGWSLSRLAEETGVSKRCSGRLSEMNPAGRSDGKIATGLNVLSRRLSSPMNRPRRPPLTRSSRRWW